MVVSLQADSLVMETYRQLDLVLRWVPDLNQCSATVLSVQVTEMLFCTFLVLELLLVETLLGPFHLILSSLDLKVMNFVVDVHTFLVKNPWSVNDTVRQSRVVHQENYPVSGIRQVVVSLEHHHVI